MVMLAGRMEFNYRRFDGKGAPWGAISLHLARGGIFKSRYSNSKCEHLLVGVDPLLYQLLRNESD